MKFYFSCASGGKCSQQVELSGENINITFKPDGTHIAVGNRVILLSQIILFITVLKLCLVRLSFFSLMFLVPCNMQFFYILFVLCALIFMILVILLRITLLQITLCYCRILFLSILINMIVLQGDELTIIDVRKFKSIHKRKFNYEVCERLVFVVVFNFKHLLHAYFVLHISKHQGLISQVFILSIAMFFSSITCMQLWIIRLVQQLVEAVAINSISLKNEEI